MTYGMLASQSCLLTDIVDQLHENSKKLILWSVLQDISTKEFRKMLKSHI